MADKEKKEPLEAEERLDGQGIFTAPVRPDQELLEKAKLWQKLLVYRKNI